MDRKMECPICEKKAVFVGVHDDEGNYHGLMGCEYENAPWSGLSYALHHEGWGDCPLCTDGAESTMGGMLFDTAEEAISALSPPNEPLTLEELREMDGEPVYSGKYKRWFLVIYFNALNKSQLMDRTGTPYITEDCAPLYRRPPEGEEEP